MYAAFSLQVLYKPFDFIDLNRTETMSITCGGISLYFGLYFIEKNLIGEKIKWLFFLILLTANLVFSGYWLLHFLHSFWFVYQNKYRKAFTSFLDKFKGLIFKNDKEEEEL